MKKKAHLLLAVVAIAGIFVIVLNACSKTDSQTPDKENYVYKEFIPTHEDVIPLIKTFNTAYKNHKLGYKSGEDMPLNEAIWTLEAGVNYEFCEKRDGVNYFYSYYTSEIIPTNYNEEMEKVVNMDVLLMAFEDMSDYVESVLNINGQENKFILADVSLEETNDNNVELIVTVKGGVSSPYSCTINNEDWWYCFDGLGKCGNYVGTYEGWDAMSRLDIILNCTEPFCSNGTPFPYSIDIYVLPGPLTGYPNSCKSNVYMQSDLDDCWDIIENYTPGNKIYLGCDSEQDLITQDPLTYAQLMNVSYGYIECKGLED